MRHLLLFDGRGKAWSLQDSSISPCAGLGSSHVAAERLMAQTWCQRAAMAKVAPGNQETRSLKQMGLTVLSRKTKRKWDHMHASEPAPALKNLSWPPLSPLTVFWLSLNSQPLLRRTNAIPLITPSDNHFMLHLSSLGYKYVCRLFAPILPVVKIRSLNQ